MLAKSKGSHPANQPAWLESFSSREIEILRLISEGKSNNEIAQQILISLETVKWYNKQIFSKLGVGSRTEALVKAREYNLLDSQGAIAKDESSQAKHNLPASLTSFIGRVKELKEIKQMLKTHRLVVLTGPGGAGKTRLALQVASDLAESYQDGAWVVELASINDPSLVANEVACTLDLNLRGDTRPVDLLKRFLARKHLLLILDNFEHLQEAAPIIGELLNTSPQLTVLATSRERLHVYGEQEYSVAPLMLPDPQKKYSMKELLDLESIQLFLERAREAQPGLVISEDEVKAMAQICLYLDGLPLAVELAASQVKYFLPSVLSSRLKSSMGALPSGPRDLPDRQRTLRGTIAWSYSLLNENEKNLFEMLGVFQGGGTIDAIEAICAEDLGDQMVDTLTALVDKNLVVLRQNEDGEPRFFQLMTIHRFALEQLQRQGRVENLQVRHANYFTQLAEQSENQMRGANQKYWFSRLRSDADNLRAVMAWSLEKSNDLHALRLVKSLRDYWFYSDFLAEGAYWTDLAMQRIQKAPPELRGGVLVVAGQIGFAHGDLESGKRYHRQAVRIFRKLGDDRGTAWALVFQAAQSIQVPMEHPQGYALCQEALALFRKSGDKPGMIQALNILGEYARVEGDDKDAQYYYQECLELVKDTQENLRISIISMNLAFIAYHRGAYQEALDLIKKNFAIMQELKYDYGFATQLAAMAGPVAALGAPERAARLLGASSTLMEDIGTTHQPGDKGEIDRIDLRVRESLGEERYQAEWLLGRAMTQEQAIAYALEDWQSK